MFQHGALIVVGSGPGVGSHVAATFARHGFRRIVLMSRDVTRLGDDAMIIRSVAPETTIDVVGVNLAVTEDVEAALEEVRIRLAGELAECIFFNAARSGLSRLLEWSAEDFQDDLQLSVVSLYTVVRWGMPQLLSLADKDEYKPAFLVTSGALCHDPLPRMFSLAACRAAQYNVMTSCAKEFGPQGIRCKLIDIQNHFGDHGPVCDAPSVAEEAWKLYSQQGDDNVVENVPDPSS